jgi:DNA repair exonuclease SbcCD ATPase subunit
MKKLMCCMLLAAAVGCQTAYYGAMEAVGLHKRDILVERVEGARDAQEEAKETFASALDEFRSVVNIRGGELEEQYEQMRAALERSEARAAEVRDRVDAVEDVAEALFVEWEAELDEYSSDHLRRQSARKLRDTRERYERLMRAMRRAEARMEPVLEPLRDQVLYLKHNLNAQAIAALEDELVTVQADVDALIRDMEEAIDEANNFIAQMR